MYDAVRCTYQKLDTKWYIYLFMRVKNSVANG